MRLIVKPVLKTLKRLTQVRVLFPPTTQLRRQTNTEMKDIQSAQLKVNACPCPLKQAELALLTLAHVQHCLQVQDVALSDGNTVHCVICGSEQSPPLLLLRDCVGAELCLAGLPFARCTWWT